MEITSMEIIDDAFVRERDEKLIAEDVKLHARPFHVAMAWMQEKKISGDIFDKSIWTPLMEAFKRLYPTGDFSMPALIVGGVALRDLMYAVRIPVGYGSFSINPIECIEISREELEQIFRHYPEQGWKAFYGVCDLIDFGYGVDDLIKTGSPAYDLLKNARSAVAATPRILSGTVDLDAAVQTACLTAELSMKAALTHIGWTEAQIKGLSHNLLKLANSITRVKPIATDHLLLTACGKFPNYVNTRYASHGLTRIELMALAMRAQFIAADSIRRITNRDMAGDMEARSDCPKRHEP
jgi:hypothetical protein